MPRRPIAHPIGAVLIALALSPSVSRAQQDVSIRQSGQAGGDVHKYCVGEHPASRDAARVRVAQWIGTVLKK